MLGSIAAHLVFGGALLWLIGNALQPASSERLLVISFAASQRDDNTTSDAASDAPTARQSEIAPAQAADQNGLRNRQAAQTQPVPQQTQRPAGKPVIQKQSTAPPQQVARPPSRAVAHAPDQAARIPSTKAEQVAATIVQAPVTTTNSERAVAAVATDHATPNDRRKQSSQRDSPDLSPARHSMSPVQEKMLNKRLKNWAENLHKWEPGDEPMRWTHKGQAYEARVSRFPAKGDTDIEKAVVEVITEQDGEILRTEMQMKMLAFSHFAQFVHRWDPRVQVHDDTLDGRFHSNSKISLGWDSKVQPRFLGKVTTASREVHYADTRGHRRREDIFAGGLETGVRSIPLARRYQMPAGNQPGDQAGTHSDPRSWAVSGNRSGGNQTKLHFPNDTDIRFQADGSLLWRDMATGREQRKRIKDGTAYLIGAAGKTLYVSGQVRGEILVYSPTRIVIVSDLTYAQPGGQDRGNQAFLGLVSGKNVEVAEPEITGPGPLYVHAAIYAQGRFKVRDYRTRENSHLYIYGSLTAGSLSATEPRFATHIEFDKRLEDKRPPGYPMTNRYELSDWDGEWTRLPYSATP